MAQMVVSLQYQNRHTISFNIQNKQKMSNNNIFGAEFYPTPHELLDTLGIDFNGKTVLEPSAGKGNIVDYAKKYGAKKVYAFESHHDLSAIVQAKSSFLGYDFLSATEVPQSIDIVVMNPPFSNADKHILKAWELAPEGCTIYSLCNYETVDNPYSQYRRNLKNLIGRHGHLISLGSAFAQADRQTNANIGFITLYKPISPESANFDGFHFETDAERDDEDGVVKFNEIKATVNTYAAALKQFYKITQEADLLNTYTKGFNIKPITFQIAYKTEATNFEDYRVELQKRAWSIIFDKLNVRKYVTSATQDRVNKFVEQSSNIPFTLRNIYNMVDIIFQTRGQTMDLAIVDIVERFTSRTKENRYALEGWKTNEHHLLGKKFIGDGYVSTGGWGKNGISANHRSAQNIDDLVKAVHFLLGTERTCTDFYPFIMEGTFGQWSDYNSWLRVKPYKKGTCHFEFTNLLVWEKLNRRYAEIKGFTLPEKIK